MFLLGLLVLAAAAVAAVELSLANRGPMDFHLWNWTWHFHAYWLAVVGAIVVTAAWIGLGLMRISFGHARRVRRENRALAAENRRLAKRADEAEVAAPVATDEAAPRAAHAAREDATAGTSAGSVRRSGAVVAD